MFSNNVLVRLKHVKVAPAPIRLGAGSPQIGLSFYKCWSTETRTYVSPFRLRSGYFRDTMPRFHHAQVPGRCTCTCWNRSGMKFSNILTAISLSLFLRQVLSQTYWIDWKLESKLKLISSFENWEPGTPASYSYILPGLRLTSLANHALVVKRNGLLLPLLTVFLQLLILIKHRLPLRLLNLSVYTNLRASFPVRVI